MSITKIKEFFRSRSNLTAFIMCVLGVAVNMILTTVVTKLELPLYLDTVGTVVIAVLGGYLPGVSVGFFTNIIRSISEPASMYYGVLNVLIAFSAAFLTDRGWHKKLRGMIGMVVVFAFIGGGLGSLIPMFMEDLAFDYESLAGTIHATGLFGENLSSVLAALIMDLPDKIITVLAAGAIIHIIPKDIKSCFRFTMWMQRPTDEEFAKRNTTQVRNVSLRTKTLIVLVFSLTVVALVCTGVGVKVFGRMTIEEHGKIASGTANLAAEAVNGDRIDNYLRRKGETDDYKETQHILRRILASSSEIKYLHVYRLEREGLRVIFDVETADKPETRIGSIVTPDPGLVPYLHNLNMNMNEAPITVKENGRYLLTAATPVYNSEGKCVCYVIADVDLLKLRADGISFLMEMITVFLGFFIVLCSFVVWLADYHLIIPINSISGSMDSLSQAEDTQESMDEDIRSFRKLGIHTGDELENLYYSASRMMKNQAEQMRSIRRLSDSTAKMQDGLIVTMADMVENRDSDTGAHVQKTAAYVKIIVEGLKKKGYYAAKLTPKFMSDVVRSAPLHDIGKINIPDGVLNKPGKLTDEEFEIMKTHTTAGKRIMENAISTVEGDNYLKEARNMAAYHHERWDGKGYPEGIHGEVIPLSARIMAVADVFDALSSPRVYKPAFPLERSLAILEEGKGTQFDPKCVEVFMDALPEVKAVLRKYNRDV